MSKFFLGLSSLLLVLCSLQPCAAGAEEGFVDLFPSDGTPEGWSVREWNDLTKEVKQAAWTVKDGVLKSDQRRGTASPALRRSCLRPHPPSRSISQPSGTRFASS